jgi:hypothetical protein
MSTFELFSFSVQQLAQHWGISINAPEPDCTIKISCEMDVEIALALSEQARRIVLGIYIPLEILSHKLDAALDRQALQIFLMQRTFTARFGSQVRYAWLGDPDRIAVFSSVPLAQAAPAQLVTVLDQMSARLDAIAEVMPEFAVNQPNQAPAFGLNEAGYV